MVDLLRQADMTDVASVSRHLLSRTVVGMAHFAGTGPSGAVCNQCTFWLTRSGKKKPICDKYRQMTGDAGKSIPGAQMSCRHFEKKAQANG